MRLFISLSAALLLAVVALLTACNSTDGSGSGSSAAKTQGSPSATAKPPAPQTQPTQQGDGVKRVTTSELKDMLDKGTAIVVDVRTDEQYKAGHIKGALHIPEAEIAARSDELPRDKMIVTYCS